jgi:hypothetical protein
MSSNPFRELYLTESISSENFVKIFSPVLLNDNEVLSIFHPGNVIVTGLQGSGKSALLNLLNPSILNEFARSSEDWPLPEECSSFYSCAINLRTSGALDFGQRPIPNAKEQDEFMHVGLHFGDFLNYWLLDDLLQNIEDLSKGRHSALTNRLETRPNASNFDRFAKSLSQHKCWFGSMANVNSLSDLRDRITTRIDSYESFLSYNSDLAPEVLSTKTRPGEPLSVAVELLRTEGVVSGDYPFFVVIDQFEDLMDLEERVTGNLSGIFRSVVLKMLGSRDERLSYRLGARPYSISQDFQGFGSGSFTEEMREYNIVHLNELLIRRESSRGLFPRFCDDVFKRHLRTIFSEGQLDQVRTIRHVFARTPTPEEKVSSVVKKNLDGIVSPDPDWPASWSEQLIEKAKTDPLSAKLGEAWIRQRVARKEDVSDDQIENEAWQDGRWWIKERKQQAMMQAISRKRQRMVWYGEDDIISLSSRNIYVFLSLSQFIWSEYLRSDPQQPGVLPNPIPRDVQNLGIHSCSTYWMRKVRAEPKGGDDRFRFLNTIGSAFRELLRQDVQMSYPGRNGFSIYLRDLQEAELIDQFLNGCVAYGALEKYRHTPKSGGKGQAVKWYLASILTPHFQIPTPHTKEPFYARIDEVNSWIDKSNVHLKWLKTGDGHQLKLDTH